MSKLSELRDRRIIQIIVGYAAAGWIVLEAASQFVERGIFPDIVYMVVLVWYLGGFFAAAIIGWYHGEKGDQKAPPLEIAMLVVVGIAVLAVSGQRVRGYLQQQQAIEQARQSEMDLRRVAVRYFNVVSGSEDYRYLADGMTEELIDQLARVRTLDVISRNGIEPFRGADVEADSVARALDAGTVVDGSVEADGDGVRINVRLIDGQSGTDIRRATLERPTDEILLVRDEMVDQVARFLREWIGDEVELRRMEQRADEDQAWILVQRAEQARRQMEEAFRHHDPEGIAEAYERADRLLEQSATLDDDWAEPVTRRAWLAYRRSRMAREIPVIADWAERGLAHAERALERQPNQPRALEARGTIRYWSWLMELGITEFDREALYDSARQDLERAVDLDPTLASAHNSLSHLYSQTDVPQAILAARTAYQEDAYLDTADAILWRLYSLSFDLRQLNQARRWCEEGSQRFPNDDRFAICQLRLMTTAAVEPDVERAWQLVALVDSTAAGVEGEWQRLNARIFAGAIVGRAGMVDSARTVLGRTRAQGTHEIDPQQELLWREAYARTVFGDYDEAIDLLKQYRAANPGHEFDQGGDLAWWWSDLRNHPRFDELTTR